MGLLCIARQYGSMEDDPAMAYVDIDGKHIYYEEYGKGHAPTLVYMHGGPGESCLTYSYQAKKLGERFHVISFDQYGVFRSDALGETEKGDVAFHIGLIERMRESLGIERWILLGHSFGGMLALVYAHTFPERVDAVIYDCPMWSALHTARAIALAAQPYFEQHGPVEQTALVEEILKDGISARDAFERSLRMEWNEELNRCCHVIETSRYHSYINEHIDDPRVTDDCWGKYVAFQQKLFASEDFYVNYLPYLAEISKVQLLIVGEYDMTCGRFEQAWFDEHAPEGRRVILDNSAHLSWFEQPERYTGLITDFVSNLEM